MPKPRSQPTLRGRVKPRDPFELIRWLALSQPDPRKALAELVQNSLDAGAHNIRVTRFRKSGLVCLRIHDDGEGIIPELDRKEALKYIATNIGHSRKRSLSPSERMELMTQGQYGIGLLGFWSLGHQMEIRSFYPGQKAHRLLLHRDQPQFAIDALRGSLLPDERATEILITGVHREAASTLIARRAADYLASELRGQLLARRVDLVIEDKMARGRAQKIVPVRPPRFLGERIEGLGPLPVPGHPPIRLEVYLSANSDDDALHRGLAVYGAGTLVAEDFHALSALGLDRMPWLDARLSGIVDFPGFRVAPGSRRGVIVDAAAMAFAEAVRTVEPQLMDALDRLEARRQEQADRSLVNDLRRAFRDFFRHQPRYAPLPVSKARDMGLGGEEGEVRGAGEADVSDIAPSDGSTPSDAQPLLLPPGPLTTLQLRPSQIRVECRGTRRARAEALDDSGRPLLEGVEYEWFPDPDLGVLVSDERHPNLATFTAGESPATGALHCRARCAGREAEAAIEVEVVEEIESARGGDGIPDPEFVHAPGQRWRTRMVEGQWEVNSAHPDFEEVADRPVLKLRYLIMLFAKEVVLRNQQDGRLDIPLEQLVEVASYADRNLAKRKKGLKAKAGEG